MKIMRLKIDYKIIKINEKENKLNIKIIFRIKKKMWKWLRKRNDKLNENEREIIYYLQKNWIKNLYKFLNTEMSEKICDIYHMNLSKKIHIIIYQK